MVKVMSFQKIPSKVSIFAALLLALLSKVLSWMVSENWFVGSEDGKCEGSFSIPVSGNHDRFEGNLTFILKRLNRNDERCGRKKYSKMPKYLTP